jgi:opacity protein-like surface antigen
MHKLLIRSVALATLLAGPAMAADIAVPVYQPPRPVYLPFSWEGCYLGVNAGWATQRIDNTLSVTNGEVPFFFLAADLPIINASGTVGLQTNGFTGGVQGGCNIQTGSLVWGFEGDVNYLRQDDQFSGTFLTSAAIPFVMTVSERKNWLATVRARVGFAADQWYFYLTGGAAALGFRFEQTYSQTTLDGTFAETATIKTGLDGPWAPASRSRCGAPSASRRNISTRSSGRAVKRASSRDWPASKLRASQMRSATSTSTSPASASTTGSPIPAGSLFTDRRRAGAAEQRDELAPPHHGQNPILGLRRRGGI